MDNYNLVNKNAFGQITGPSDLIQKNNLSTYVEPDDNHPETVRVFEVTRNKMYSLLEGMLDLQKNKKQIYLNPFWAVEVTWYLICLKLEPRSNVIAHQHFDSFQGLSLPPLMLVLIDAVPRYGEILLNDKIYYFRIPEGESLKTQFLNNNNWDFYNERVRLFSKNWKRSGLFWQPLNVVAFIQNGKWINNAVTKSYTISSGTYAIRTGIPSASRRSTTVVERQNGVPVLVAERAGLNLTQREVEVSDNQIVDSVVVNNIPDVDSCKDLSLTVLFAINVRPINSYSWYTELFGNKLVYKQESEKAVAKFLLNEGFYSVMGDKGTPNLPADDES
jgi:hypothetical protein